MAYFEIKNIETYYGLIRALKGISMALEQNSTTAVLGNNGAGKSTILKTVIGLIKDQPEKGTIEFMGRTINGKSPENLVRMGISYVPEGREVFERLSVRENLLMGAYRRHDRAGIRKDLNGIHDYFPVLKERENQLAGTLSGGEQQMLAMGRALMNRPKLLFLDEPSLGLSPLMVKEIFRIIGIIKNEGVTILLVEQNARMALNISGFGFILENGHFVIKGESRELMENENVKEFYLGVKKTESAYRGRKRNKRWR